ncbi:MAG: EamA family transporter RarD [Tateyamaria sp.]|jgi:chloramphenicol-sensitive protein RarD|nr:EamA family transporter RarD [Tateyamaria sp.]MCH9746585.1 EamA family transporter RarD [Alphaproteobacteria bacterium]HAB39428.1 EamA family transporter RarD [Paracoccaceae bacterium]MBT5302250.1 EamA family transporter RarD [Tateyamaria sp.]MBT6267274.1 EamA family transporter RarD [Tateyamaria sp.]
MTQQSGDTPKGLGFALGAYFLWGLLPIYMKMLSHIGPAEVVAHRIIWSVPIAGILLIILGRTKDLRVAISNPSMLIMGCFTAGLITINWGIYIWAIASGRTLDAALGYYINPLFSLALGVIFLRERPSPAQLIAIGLAVCAVAVLTISMGKVPWVSLGLTVSWGLYALCKKQLPIGPNQGFLLEVLILLVPALCYITYLGLTGQSSFLVGDMRTNWLLLGCGIVTAIPLILYANGAKELQLSTIAVLQYIAPTMIFLVAVFVFGEEFGNARIIAFPIIWLALIIYSTSMVRQMRAATSP